MARLAHSARSAPARRAAATHSSCTQKAAREAVPPADATGSMRPSKGVAEAPRASTQRAATPQMATAAPRASITPPTCSKSAASPTEQASEWWSARVAPKGLAPPRATRRAQSAKQPPLAPPTLKNAAPRVLRALQKPRRRAQASRRLWLLARQLARLLPMRPTSARHGLQRRPPLQQAPQAADQPLHLERPPAPLPERSSRPPPCEPLDSPPIDHLTRGVSVR